MNIRAFAFAVWLCGCTAVFGNELTTVFQRNAVQSSQIQPGEKFITLYQLWTPALPAGNYLLKMEVMVENGTGAGNLRVTVSAGKEHNSISSRNEPYYQLIQIPIRVFQSSGIRVSFSGEPKLTAPGKIQIRNLRFLKQDSLGGNLIPPWNESLRFRDLPSGNWGFSANRGSEKNLKLLSVQDGIVTLSPRSRATISTPMMILPPNTKLRASVQAKGIGRLRFRLFSRGWKYLKEWNGTHVGSPWFQTVSGKSEYVFPVTTPQEKRYLQLFIEAISIDEMEISHIELIASPRGEEKNETEPVGTIVTCDFEQPLPESSNVEIVTDPVLGKCAVFSGNSRLKIPFGEERSLPQGTLSFWFQLENDLVYEAAQQGIWQIGNTSLLGKMWQWGFYFGNKSSTEYKAQIQIFKREWHHLVYVWNCARERKIYLDGRQVAQAPWISGVEKASGITFGRQGRLPSFRGRIAQVCLYPGMKSAKEIVALYAEKRPVTPFLLDASALAGKKSVFRIGFDNSTATKRREQGQVQVAAPDGTIVATKSLAAEIPPHSYVIRSFEFTPETVGDYRVTFRRENGDTLTGIAAVIRGTPKPETEFRKRLIAEVDCSVNIADPRKYAETDSCRIGRLNGTAFRETQGKTLASGFTYRIALKNPGKMHLLEFEYPDDRCRTFYCAVSQADKDFFHRPFLDACAVITGGNFPVTSRICRKTLLFKTASNRPDIGVIFGSHYNRQAEGGPAVSRFRLYEVDGTLPRNPINPDGRKIMNWNEDPTMFFYTWFNQNQWNRETSTYDFWREKMDLFVEYYRYIGWSLWSTLFYDYGGLSSPGDRRLNESLYCKGHFPPAFLDMFVKTAERESIPYYLSICHLSGLTELKLPTGSVLEMGEGAISRDFQEAERRGEEAPELFSSENKLAGLKRMLNPIHPKTVAAMKKIFRACVERYGDSPMFRGIDYQSQEALHFSSPEFGYGDYCISRYRQESGSAIPNFTGTDRFGKRYQWLKENEWESWLDWRCRKITELVRELAAELKGRKLIYRVTVEHLLSFRYRQSLLRKPLELGSIPDLRRLHRENGVDLAALAAIPNVMVLPDIRPNYSRIHNLTADERAMNFSDELFSLWKIPGVRNAQITQAANLEIWQGGGVVPTSKGPSKRNLISFSTALPDNQFVLENLAWITAQCDPLMLNHGWWGNPENGAYDEFRAFYRAFSEIPERSFAAVPGINDPVFVRQSGDLLYAVNLCAWPAEVQLLAKLKFVLTDRVSGKRENPDALRLNGFELRVFRQDRETPVTGTVQNPPKELVRGVEQRLKAIPANLPAGLRAEKLFRARRFAAAWYALQHRTLQPFYHTAPLEFSGEFLPDGKTVEVKIRNFLPRTVSVQCFLQDIPAGWRFSEKEKSLKIASETESRLTFSLVEGEATPGKCYRMGLCVKAEGREESRSIRVQMVTAGYLETLSESNPGIPDSFRRYPLICCNADRESDSGADYSVAWNPRGLALTIRVKDDDFLPPTLADRFWTDDSAVVYFGRYGSAREGVQEYHPGDVTYRIALFQGRAVVAVGDEMRKESRVTAKIFNQNGVTHYELFFPAAVLNELKMEPGSNCSFSLEAINRRVSKSRLVFAPHPEHPSKNPFVWSRLILAAPAGK